MKKHDGLSDLISKTNKVRTWTGTKQEKDKRGWVYVHNMAGRIVTAAAESQLVAFPSPRLLTDLERVLGPLNVRSRGLLAGFPLLRVPLFSRSDPR